MVDIRVEKIWLGGVQSGIVLMNTHILPVKWLLTHASSGACIDLTISILNVHIPTAGPIVYSARIQLSYSGNQFNLSYPVFRFRPALIHTCGK